MPHPGRRLDDRMRAREAWLAGTDAATEAEAGASLWEPRFRVSGWPALWVPVIISFLVQIPAALLTWHARRLETTIDDEPWRFAARLGLALVGPLALLFARRHPGPVVAVVSAAAGAYVLLVSGSAAPPYVAVAFAIVGAVVRGARRWAWWSVGIAWVVTVALGIVLRVPWQPALLVAVSLGLVLLFAIGESLRTRRRRFDEYRRRLAERRQTAAQAERVRIARELHDVLAHSLSQINVQAGVGLHLIDTDPAEAAKALANIKGTSKSALDEVRSVLGVLRGDPSAPDAVADPSEAPLVPEPDLSRLPGLVESVASQGLDVRFSNEIVDAPQAVQLALYRIVQEALTNVVRHADARSATVRLTQSATAYTATISDDGAGLASGTGFGSEPAHEGRGLLGMRERAELLGGRLTAGPNSGGSVGSSIPGTTGTTGTLGSSGSSGFTVEATFPR
ncbi:MAG: sensor histidine kinase [Herbiconiux sp.]|uniref:sensor histidine kinase n=1 Tax=Herbiconiux sp. TaxID=1871186 RepID=UPI00120820C0|nr:sensor histidine kinase [Herbiconiux sp.]TAJ49510.1 MAG: sensor histidine kinase [Herbiconiux sp.]